jgi:hypothetical protein
VPTPLHKEATWLKQEIALCKQFISETEAYPPGAEKDSLLKKLHETLSVHEHSLAELEKKIAERP